MEQTNAQPANNRESRLINLTQHYFTELKKQLKQYQEQHAKPPFNVQARIAERDFLLAKIAELQTVVNQIALSLTPKPQEADATKTQTPLSNEPA